VERIASLMQRYSLVIFGLSSTHSALQMSSFVRLLART